MSSIQMIEENLKVIIEYLIEGVMSKEDFDISFKFIVDKAREKHRTEIMDAYRCAIPDPDDWAYWPSLNYYNEKFNTK